MAKWIKNIDTVNATYFGQLLAPDEFFQIDHNLYDNYTNCNTIKNAINNDKLKASIDGVNTIDDKVIGISCIYDRSTDQHLIIENLRTPTSAISVGYPGMICIDANYIYVCIAVDTWKRVAIATW